jgi:conjugal transfer pilus assembly protein TraK
MKDSVFNILFWVLISICFLLITAYAGLSFGETLKGTAPDREEQNGPPATATLPTEGAVTVMPEIAQSVELSSSDVNRITCVSEIKDVIFSKEKGITVKFSGKDAFVKFLTTRKEGQTTYSTVPSELFIVCGENVYSIIAIPRRIPARSVRLSSGRMENVKKNRSLLGSLPFEKKILSVIKSLYTEEIPDSFTVTTLNRKVEMFRDLDLILARVAVIEGEGIQAKEYRALLPAGGKEKIELSEKDFLRNEISLRPLAISLDRLVLKKGETLRIFVVESNREESDIER